LLVSLIILSRNHQNYKLWPNGAMITMFSSIVTRRFLVLEKALRGTKIIKLISPLEVTKLHLCDTQVSLYYLSLWRYNHILVA